MGQAPLELLSKKNNFYINLIIFNRFIKTFK